MKRFQALLILTLFLLPFLILLGAGAWALWSTGRLFWLWWAFPVCWGLVFLLQRWWKLFVIPMPGARIEPPLHWAPQDVAALQLVEARQKRVDEIPSEKLAEPRFYVDVARDVSLEIARHYHPKAANPWDSATMIEILAAAQLALADVEAWAAKYVPGSHLVSLKTWRSLENAKRWQGVAYHVYWAGSILANPLNLGRLLASKLAIEPLTGQVQANVLGLFYVFFVRQVGFYAIELNSGRLRGGVTRYRAALARLNRAGDAASTSPTGDAFNPTVDSSAAGRSTTPPAARGAETGENGAHIEHAAQNTDAPEPLTVTIAVVGQVKAGKSSLVNALLGERRAASDVLPATRGATEYQLRLDGAGDRLVLLDTAGYGSDADGARAWNDSQDAVQRSDLVLLVLKATSPARDADVRFVESLRDWHRARPHLRPPRIVVVLTHIDGLSPAMEWSPPYAWDAPTTAKEEHIRDAVRYAFDTFGDAIVGVVPVCADVARGRAWGIDEALVPALWQHLGDARGTSFVRTLRAVLDRGSLKQVLHQVREAASRLVAACLPRK